MCAPQSPSAPTKSYSSAFVRLWSPLLKFHVRCEQSDIQFIVKGMGSGYRKCWMCCVHHCQLLRLIHMAVFGFIFDDCRVFQAFWTWKYASNWALFPIGSVWIFFCKQHFKLLLEKYEAMAFSTRLFTADKARMWQGKCESLDSDYWLRSNSHYFITSCGSEISWPLGNISMIA